jgi:hypothetical protein
LVPLAGAPIVGEQVSVVPRPAGTNLPDPYLCERAASSP